jgi:hypothetical protein
VFFEIREQHRQVETWKLKVTKLNLFKFALTNISGWVMETFSEFHIIYFAVVVDIGAHHQVADLLAEIIRF